jgi:hypothetical protein
MAVQQQTDIEVKSFIQSGKGLIKSGQTVVQDAGRGAVDMEFGTVMVYDPATLKWNSFTDETAIDGTAHPRGILMRKLDAADIVAGDVEDVPILVGGGCTVDNGQLVIENSKTLATVVNVPTNLNASVEDLLRQTGIFVETTIDITETA